MTIVQYINSSIINHNSIIITPQSSVIFSYKIGIPSFFSFMKPTYLLLFNNIIHN